MPPRFILPWPVLVCVCPPGYPGRGLLTVGLLGAPREVKLSGMAIAGNDDWLFHYVDAVALHQILKEVEDFLGPGALECKYPWRSRGRKEAPLTLGC